MTAIWSSQTTIIKKGWYKNMKAISIGNRYEIYEDSLKSYDRLPVHTYTVRFDNGIATGTRAGQDRICISIEPAEVARHDGLQQASC